MAVTEKIWEREERCGSVEETVQTGEQQPQSVQGWSSLEAGAALSVLDVFSLTRMDIYFSYK